MRNLRKGRDALKRIVKNSKFREALERDVLKRKLKGTKLGMRYGRRRIPTPFESLNQHQHQPQPSPRHLQFSPMLQFRHGFSYFEVCGIVGLHSVCHDRRGGVSRRYPGATAALLLTAPLPCRDDPRHPRCCGHCRRFGALDGLLAC